MLGLTRDRMESRQSGSSRRTRPIRRRRGGGQISHPGIPGAVNQWFPSRGQARRAALRFASQVGQECQINWNPGHAPGQPAHYHVRCPELDERDVPTGRMGDISAHFYYGQRKPQPAPMLPGRGNRWYRTPAEALRAAARLAAYRGPGHRVEGGPGVKPGQYPRYYVVDRNNQRVSPYFFFGQVSKRRPRW